MKRHNYNTTHALFSFFLESVITLKAFSLLNLYAAFQPSLHFPVLFFLLFTVSSHQQLQKLVIFLPH